MGNYASCAMAGAAGSKAIKVVFPEGEVRTFKEPVNAAELMFEVPNTFVVNARSLEMGRRFSPLNADEDLALGNAYVLFPMKKLNAVVSSTDVSSLILVANKKSKSKSKVMPLTMPVDEEAAPEMMKLADMAEELNMPQIGHRRSLSRSKKPVLETIVEETL